VSVHSTSDFSDAAITTVIVANGSTRVGTLTGLTTNSNYFVQAKCGPSSKILNYGIERVKTL